MFLPIGSREFSVLYAACGFFGNRNTAAFPTVVSALKFQCNRLLAGFLGNPYYFTTETFLNATLMCGIILPPKRDRLDNPTKLASAIVPDGEGSKERGFLEMYEYLIWNDYQSL